MKLILSNPKTDQIKSNLFFSGILAIIIIVLWIGMSVYVAFSNHEPDKEMNALLSPIDPTIDLDILREYQASRVIPPQEFEIIVKEDDKKTEGRTYSLNPFTNATRQVNSSPTEPTLDEEPVETPTEEPVEETVEEPVE